MIDDPRLPYLPGTLLRLPLGSAGRLYGYPSHCPGPRCAGQYSTMFETRAVESQTGRPLEIEVCTRCGRVDKVSML